jgi:hypothetical protein
VLEALEMPAANNTLTGCGKVVAVERPVLRGLGLVVYNSTAPSSLEPVAEAAPGRGLKLPAGELAFPASLFYYAAKGDASRLILVPRG